MLAKLAKQYGVPVVGLAGSVGEGVEPLFEQGFSSIFSIVNGPMDLDRAMQQAADLLRRASHQVARTIRMAQDL
jgi:glycerate kinase